MLHPGRVNGTWDKVQMELKCCGFANYTDWARLDSGNYTKGETPDSCCKIVHDYCGLNTTASTKNTEGCLFQFKTWYMYNIIMPVAPAVWRMVSGWTAPTLREQTLRRLRVAEERRREENENCLRVVRREARPHNHMYTRYVSYELYSCLNCSFFLICFSFVQTDYTQLRDGWSWSWPGDERRVTIGRPLTLDEVRRTSVLELKEALWRSPGPWAKSSFLTESEWFTSWMLVLGAMGRCQHEEWDPLREAMACPELVTIARMLEAERKVNLVTMLGPRVAKLVGYHARFSPWVERDLYSDDYWVEEEMEWSRRHGVGTLHDDVEEANRLQTMQLRAS